MHQCRRVSLFSNTVGNTHVMHYTTMPMFLVLTAAIQDKWKETSGHQNMVCFTISERSYTTRDGKATEGS
jgi:hypothetical protein